MSKKSNKSSWALLQVDLIRYSQRKTQKDWILIFNLKELEQGIIKFFYANILFYLFNCMNYVKWWEMDK